jgi:formate hydrogenlyase transcriptional activator
VAINCAAMPEPLLESEMFGHRKGSFTGADREKPGLLETANGGTLFLDELTEMSLPLQAKLLRVIQDGVVRRVGSESQDAVVHVRFISATNRDLTAEVASGRFRQDLFYRLNVFPVHVPALRERRDDIPMLVRHFAQQFARRMKKTIETIPAETMDVLTGYEWPGNIRELQNLIERAVILSPGPSLDVPLMALSRRAQPSPQERPIETLEESDRRHILAALESSNWVIAGPNGAAARLGMKRSTLQFRIRKLGIVRPDADARRSG